MCHAVCYLHDMNILKSSFLKLFNIGACSSVKNGLIVIKVTERQNALSE